MEFISGEKIQFSCDHFVGTIQDFRFNPNVVQYKNKFIYLDSNESINNKPFVFCYTHLLDNTNELIRTLKCLQNKFILIFHNSDGNFNDKQLILFEKLPLLQRIYTQNINVEHEKVIPLPIGLANSQWNHGNPTIHQEVYEMPIEKTKNIYFNFSKNTNRIKRDKCYDEIIKKGIKWTENLPYKKYLIELKRNKYAICPEGNGIDTHRFWECLYMNTIPICLKNKVTEYYKKYFPIILLNEWQDLDINNLLYSTIEHQYLDMDYIIKQIKVLTLDKINSNNLMKKQNIFTNEQLSYMQNTEEFVQGKRCYDLEIPWMDAGAIHWLNDNLKSDYNCLEFGTGGSTLFFSKLLKSIDTYESDYEWYKLLNEKNTSELINYNYVDSQKALISKLLNIKDNYYDVCVVDIGDSLKGRNREDIFLKCISKMKKTTIYVLDNGFSKHHYFNIWKWELVDFQKLLGNHYDMIDFNNAPFNKYNGTRILYPTEENYSIDYISMKTSNKNKYSLSQVDNSIQKKENIYLYAGDLKKWNRISVDERFKKTGKEWIGLTLPKYGKEYGTDDKNHVLFDILDKMPLADNTVDIYQSEDVHEHIHYEKLVDQINDIYRVLKPNGLFRLSVPDYNSDILYNRTQKDDKGNLLFDKGGGYLDTKDDTVKGNGHVWFPTYENVKTLLENTKFKNINFLHYWIDREKHVINKINYKNGYIYRTPDHDSRVMNPRRPMSLVVDCYKSTITNAIPVVLRHIQHLETCVEHILNQTLLPNELIIIISEYDDSNDSKQYIDKIKTNVPSSINLIIKTFCEKQYAGKNRQIAYNLCSSDIIIYQDCDDIVHKQRNEILFKTYLDTKIPHILHGWTHEKAAQFRDINFDNIELAHEFNKIGIYTHNGAIFMNKSIIGNITFPDIRNGQDTLLNNLISKKHKSILLLCNDIYIYNEHLSSW